MRDAILKQRSDCNRTFIRNGYPKEFQEIWNKRKVSDYRSRKDAGYAVFSLMNKELAQTKAELESWKDQAVFYEQQSKEQLVHNVNLDENYSLKAELEAARKLIEEAYPEMMLLKYKAVQEKAEPYKYIEWQERAKEFLKIKEGE